MIMMAYLVQSLVVVLSQQLLLLAASAAPPSGVLPVLPPVVYATCVACTAIACRAADAAVHSSKTVSGSICCRLLFIVLRSSSVTCQHC